MNALKNVMNDEIIMIASSPIENKPGLRAH